MAAKNINRPYRKTAVTVGILFIIGTAAGILSGVFTISTLALPINLILIAENTNQIVLGSIFVLIMGFPLAMIPAVLYPIFKKYNEVLALGAVIFRGILEAVCYIAIVIGWLSLISLSKDYVNASAQDAVYYQTLGEIILAAVNWMNVIMAIVFCLGALMIYYLFIKTRLVPLWLSGWGFIGGLLYFAAPFISMFYPELPLSLDSTLGFLMGPLALQEMVFALWLIIKGFDPAAAEAAQSA